MTQVNLSGLFINKSENYEIDSYYLPNQFN